MLVQPRRSRIVEPHCPDERVRVQHVGRHVEALSDVVLQQAVDDHDVAPDELLPPGHPLPGDEPVMGDELQVEPGHADTCVALARRGLADVADAALEREVAALDDVAETGPVERRGGHVDECGVPSSFASLKAGRSAPTITSTRSARMS